MITIRQVKPTEFEVAALITFHLSGMAANSPKDSIYALNQSDLTLSDIKLFGAFDFGRCLSIGALKTSSKDDGEIKSMRTDEAALGRGLGKAVLTQILKVARKKKLTRLLLETGTGPAFAAAHHIYWTHGFEACGPFGNYEQSAFNRFFCLKL